MPRPYFYKLVLNSTIQERRLRIPDNFLKKFKDEIAQVVTLHIPDGHIWRVGVRKVENKYWLHDGWQDFVQHYSIGLGYFLVFRYEGNSVFNVYIYNLTNSEINYHPSARSTAGEHFQSRQYHVFKDMEDEDLADLFGSSSPRQTPETFKKKAANASADQLSLNRGFNPTALQNLFNGNMNPPDKSAVSSQQGIRPPEQVSPFSGAVKVKSDGDEVRVQPLTGTASKPKKASRKKRKSEAIAGEPLTAIPPDASSEMRFRFYASASSRKRTVTAEERERAVNSAKMFEPPNPFCRVVLRPSYLYRGCIMYLPSCFAEKNLNGVSGFIKIQRADGKQWSVRCLYKGGRAKLSQGWYDFTLENNLEEGDVCVFELLSAREEVTLKVTTFRVVDDVALLTQPQQQQHHPR